MKTGITLKTKMIVFCLLIGLLPLAFMGVYAYRTAARSLDEGFFAQLTSLREVKGHAASEIVASWRGDMAAFSRSQAAGDALQRLEAFADGPAGMRGGRVAIETPEYRELHKRGLRDFDFWVREKGYYDAFILDGAGRVLFTVAQEPDLGQDVSGGELSSSGLGRAWKEAMRGGFAFVDFEPYAPSNGAPAAFVAAPIENGGAVTGVAVLQVPLDKINALMHLRDGLGQTGETYLVGPDKLMRSDSYLDRENRSVVASFRNPARGTVDTEASRQALAGSSGTRITPDYNGNPVLSSYAPLDVFGTKWAIIAEIDEAEVFAPVYALRNAMLVAGALVLLLVVACTLYILRRELLRPLGSIQAFAGEVAAGNLDASAQGTFKAEIAQLHSSISVMVGALKEKMGEAEAKSREAGEQAARAQAALGEAEEQQRKVATLLERMKTIAKQADGISARVSSASEELTAQVEQVGAGAAVQRDRMQETATAMEQISATVMEVARNSGNAAESSGTAKNRATEGAAVVQEAVAAIAEVNRMASTLKENMRGLGQQAESIGQVLTVITDIADQTNLLALNAAIEAARAGDAGRGFAVVADEVRKLAEKTMNATREVGERIHSIQSAASTNIDQVDTAARAVQVATDKADSSGKALANIVTLVDDTAGQVSGIATAAEEQSAAMEQINRSVEEVTVIVGQTTRGMEQATEAIQDLAGQIAELRQLILALESASR